MSVVSLHAGEDVERARRQTRLRAPVGAWGSALLQNPARSSSASNTTVDLMPGGRHTGGVVGVKLRSGEGGGAGVLDTQGWTDLLRAAWYMPSSPEEESQSRPTHLSRDDDAAAVPVAVGVKLSSFCKSPEMVERRRLPTHQKCPGAPPFQQACTISFGRNGCGNHADNHTLLSAVAWLLDSRMGKREPESTNDQSNTVRALKGRAKGERGAKVEGAAHALTTRQRQFPSRPHQYRRDCVENIQ